MNGIAKDVFHLPLMIRNAINCYIIEGVLVDSGVKGSFNKIAREAERIPIHSHVITHAHPDHQGSSAAICNKLDLPFICHSKEIERAESGMAIKDYPSKNSLVAKFQQKFWSGPGYKVSRTIKENDLVGNFRVIETPGHSPGHLSFFREEDGVLILGDAAVNMNLLTTFEGLHLPPSIFTLNQKENIRSLKKIKHLKPRIICFGHGPVLFNKDRKFENFIDKCMKKL